MKSTVRATFWGGLSLVLVPGFLAAQDSHEHMCKVDLNKPAYYAHQSYQDFQQAVVPALRRVGRRHNTAYMTYVVPFQDFWDLAGLTPIFGAPAFPPCCPACGSARCLPEIEFTRKVGTDEATFRWTSNLSQPLTAYKQLGDLEFELEIPQQFQGYATVGPDLVHLQFGDGLPKLRITDKDYNKKKTVMFDDGVMCIGSSPQWATMRPYHQSPAIPHLPLVIDTK